MNSSSINQSSFSLLALCFCQSCIVVSKSSSTYIQCNQHLIAGHAKALEGDWKQAALIWSQLANSGNNAACGKAAYNMVVACEMLNRRDLAIDWAHKALNEYKSSIAKRRAFHYLRLLNKSENVHTVMHVATSEK
ncbi:MAG: hypothetical protein JKY52_04385 [Flavobacteriales bacterium]|nr:hypothetical protein [Flavobacteriales bacterium]